MKMFYKKNNCIVELIKVFEDKKTALIFHPFLASKQGNGWTQVPLKYLIPEEYYDRTTENFMSKSSKNKIKERLTLKYAEWECTDGTIYTSCEDAIAHETILKEKENN